MDVTFLEMVSRRTVENVAFSANSLRFCFLTALESSFDNVEEARVEEGGAVDEGERRESSLSGEATIPTKSVVVSGTEGEEDDNDGDDMVINTNYFKQWCGTNVNRDLNLSSN